MKTSDYRVLSTHTVKQIYHSILISNQKLSDSDKYKMCLISELRLNV